MSFKRKLISAVTSAAAVVAFSSFAAAQDTNKEDNSMQKQEMREMRGGRRGSGKGMRGGKHGGGDRMLMRVLGKLNLTDAQKEQVRTISDNFKTSNQSLFEEMRSLGMKKRDGVITADEQARAKELKTQLKASSEQMKNSVMAILTDEQKTQLEQMKAEMKQKMMERRQNRMNRQNEVQPQTQDN